MVAGILTLIIDSVCCCHRNWLQEVPEALSLSIERDRSQQSRGVNNNDQPICLAMGDQYRRYTGKSLEARYLIKDLSWRQNDLTSPKVLESGLLQNILAILQTFKAGKST